MLWHLRMSQKYTWPTPFLSAYNTATSQYCLLSRDFMSLHLSFSSIKWLAIAIISYLRKRRTMLSPMPLEPPVIRATFSDSFWSADAILIACWLGCKIMLSLFCADKRCQHVIFFSLSFFTICIFKPSLSQLDAFTVLNRNCRWHLQYFNSD